jgi:hypothetical protein
MRNSHFSRIIIAAAVMLIVMACSLPSIRPVKPSATPSVKAVNTVAAATLPVTKGAATAISSPIPTRAITEQKAPTTPAITDAPKSSTSEYPLPKDAKNVITLPDMTIFQTGMSLKDSMAFYRETFTKQGLKERNLLSVTSDKTFSMVFDGAKDGKSVIVQGVDLGGGVTNITLRYDKV